MAQTIRNLLLIALAFAIALLSEACANHSAEPLPDPAQSYTVLSSVADSSTSSIAVKIRIFEPLTQERVKAVAEAALARYKDQFQTILIESYVRAGQPNELPYAISNFENGQLVHRFNPQATPQKIPTH